MFSRYSQIQNEALYVNILQTPSRPSEWALRTSRVASDVTQQLRSHAAFTEEWDSARRTTWWVMNILNSSLRGCNAVF